MKRLIEWAWSMRHCTRIFLVGLRRLSGGWKDWFFEEGEMEDGHGNAIMTNNDVNNINDSDVHDDYYDEGESDEMDIEDILEDILGVKDKSNDDNDDVML